MEDTAILAERSTKASKKNLEKPTFRDLRPIADGRRPSRGFGRSPRTTYDDLKGTILLRSQSPKAEHGNL